MNETNNQPNQPNQPNQQSNVEVRAIERKVRRPRSDSNWKNLTVEQCETVEQWLFEERLSYRETAERVKKEFGMETSPWSVGRYYRNRARMRRSMELLEAQVDADKLGTMPARTEDLRAGAVKLLAKNAMALGVERPEDVEGLMALTRVLLHSEENEIRLRRVKLEERYYDFEANTMCAKELEKVRSYLRTVGDNESLSAEEKQQLVIGLLFGKDKVNEEDVDEAEKAEERDGVLTPEQKRRADSGKILSTEEARERVAAEQATAAEVKKATSPQPNGFPSPPQDSSPKVDERFALRGPPEAERENGSEPQARHYRNLPPAGGTERKKDGPAGGSGAGNSEKGAENGGKVV